MMINYLKFNLEPLKGYDTNNYIIMVNVILKFAPTVKWCVDHNSLPTA